MENEVWKEIAEFKRYEVSTLGNIRSKGADIYIRGFYIWTRPSVILKPQATKFGYLRVPVRNDKKKLASIHRLVALTFLLNPHSKSEVNHIDGNKANNRLENLEWCTSKENKHHAIRTGLVVFKSHGENASNVLLTEKDVLEIRRLHREGKMTQREIAKNFNTGYKNLNGIVLGKTWKRLL